MKTESNKHYQFNLFVNLFDGGFFGFALGFASFMTILPLFVSTLTSSAILIGLIPAIHSMGWQLPQLFTAQRVSSLRLYKPMVLFMTIHERLPFFGMAIVSWFMPQIGPRIALILTFMFLIWQGVGGGLTATAWTSMIGKIVPADRRGTFFGMQSAMANLLSSITAIIAGVILEKLDSPLDFTLCFLFAAFGMILSFIFLSLTRENESEPSYSPKVQSRFWGDLLEILKRDSNFRWFLIVRMLTQLTVMAFAFYTVYAVRRHGMSEGQAGLMMATLSIGQIIANPIMGWAGDRWSHTAVMKIGALAASLSALLAWRAPGLGWFYLVFVLAGIANVSIWTIGLAITLEFGSESERPAYIGLANTLVAPATILAPVLGGWLADTSGYSTTFMVSVISGLATAAIIHWMVKDPRRAPSRQSFDPELEITD